MWLDYESRYKQGLADPANILWRETGARQKARNILDVCQGRPIVSVLEIGCGTGAVIQKLSECAFATTYIASDISPSALEALCETSRGWLAGAMVASADRLPLNDGAVSVAILSHVVEHLENPRLAIREAARVAGLLVLEVPCERVLTNFIRTKILRRDYAAAGDAGHVQFWSPRSFERFITRDCQLEILSRKRDLVSREVEFFGKTGPKKCKALFKHSLKLLLPTAVYTRMFTTHLTLLCRPMLTVPPHAGPALVAARLERASE